MFWVLVLVLHGSPGERPAEFPQYRKELECRQAAVDLTAWFAAQGVQVRVQCSRAVST